MNRQRYANDEADDDSSVLENALDVTSASSCNVPLIDSIATAATETSQQSPAITINNCQQFNDQKREQPKEHPDSQKGEGCDRNDVYEYTASDDLASCHFDEHKKDQEKGKNLGDGRDQVPFPFIPNFDMMLTPTFCKSGAPAPTSIGEEIPSTTKGILTSPLPFSASSETIVTACVDAKCFDLSDQQQIDRVEVMNLEKQQRDFVPVTTNRTSAENSNITSSDSTTKTSDQKTGSFLFTRLLSSFNSTTTTATNNTNHALVDGKELTDCTATINYDVESVKSAIQNDSNVIKNSVKVIGDATFHDDENETANENRSDCTPRDNKYDANVNAINYKASSPLSSSSDDDDDDDGDIVTSLLHAGSSPKRSQLPLLYEHEKQQRQRKRRQNQNINEMNIGHGNKTLQQPHTNASHCSKKAENSGKVRKLQIPRLGEELKEIDSQFQEELINLSANMQVDNSAVKMYSEGSVANDDPGEGKRQEHKPNLLSYPSSDCNDEGLPKNLLGSSKVKVLSSEHSSPVEAVDGVGNFDQDEGASIGEQRNGGVRSFQSYDDDDDDDHDQNESDYLEDKGIPQHVEFHSDFEIVGPLLTTWKAYDENDDVNDPDEDSFLVDSNKRSKNNDKCFENIKVATSYGIVHVRILRAQQLACPIHSDVYAVVSLPPWKGKIRSKTAKAFSGPVVNSRGNNSGSNKVLDHNRIITGVCAEWDEDKVPPILMIHDPLSSDDGDGASPVIPSINIELIFCPLGISFVELNMGSFSVSCLPLFQHPMVSRRQWFVVIPTAEQATETNTTARLSPKSSNNESKSISLSQVTPPPRNRNGQNQRLNTISSGETESDVDSTTSLLFAAANTAIADDHTQTEEEAFGDDTDWLTSTNKGKERQTKHRRWPLIEIEAMFEPVETSATSVQYDSTDIVQREQHQQKSIVASPTSNNSKYGDINKCFSNGIDANIDDATDRMMDEIERPFSSRGRTPHSVRPSLQQQSDDDGDGNINDNDNTSKDTNSERGATGGGARFSRTPLSVSRSRALNRRIQNRSSGGSVENSSVSTQTMNRIDPTPSHSQHLFRTITHWTPAVCCVCRRSIMSGLWRVKGYHCEECNVDCCSDCRLQVDIQLPCGSTLAADAVEMAIQNKLTIDNIMSVVAPVIVVENDVRTTTAPAISADEKRSNKRSSAEDIAGCNSMLLGSLRTNIECQETLKTQPFFEDDLTNTFVSPNKNMDAEKKVSKRSLDRGIGTMKINFVRAHVLKDPMPLETDGNDIAQVISLSQPTEQQHQQQKYDTSTELLFRPGDYYVRVTWTGSDKSARTRTIHSSIGRPKFRSTEMHFTVKHYGTNFRIEVVDASTDKAIGSTILTAQNILQQQRDYLIEEMRMPFLYFLMQGPLRFDKLRRIVLEIRTGLSDFEFFNAPKHLQNHQTLPTDGKTRPGDVVGCIELLVGLEEDLDSLYGSEPYVCPPRPGDELNMALFQVHMTRITALIDDVKSSIELFQYLVSWKDPILTAVSLYFFVALVAVFDPSYIGSFPVLLIILWMIYLAAYRSYGKRKEKFIQKEIEENRKAQNVSIDYSIHRPVGHVTIQVVSGKSIRSPELGLPGNVGCRVYWDPTRFLDSRRKEELMAIDKAARSIHDIGTTNYVYSVNPQWEQFIPSNGVKRLNQLIPNDGNFFGSPSVDTEKEIDFPILQPFHRLGEDLFSLEPWDKSSAAVVVEVKFNDVLSVLPGSEYSMGEIAIALSDIVRSGEVSGWFPIVNAYAELLTIEQQNQTERGTVIALDHGTESSELDNPQIFLKLKWIPPSTSSLAEANETEKEASHVIQEEMVKAALVNNQHKLSIVGSSIDAFNTMKGLSSNLLLVQNTLGSVLDMLEHGVQCVNFTDPFKSFMVLGLMILLWVVLSIIPSRVIVLLMGLSQYAIEFQRRFRGSASDVDPCISKENETEEPPYVTWIMNAIRGLPTSEDLRKTYFWESRRLGTREMSSYVETKRQYRMERLWRVRWHGIIEILALNKNRLESQTAFALLQGHRFLWWRSTIDFDAGCDPIGYVSLSGHAGLASPSPLEVRELKPSDLPRLLCIFGRGERRQERLTMLTYSIEAKRDLERVVEDVVSRKQD